MTLFSSSSSFLLVGVKRGLQKGDRTRYPLLLLLDGGTSAIIVSLGKSVRLRRHLQRWSSELRRERLITMRESLFLTGRVMYSIACTPLDSRSVPRGERVPPAIKYFSIEEMMLVFC
jgi:hypothetical protein